MDSVLPYGGFLGFVVVALLADLKLHGGPHETSTKEAAAWVGVWVGIAVAFGVIVYFWRGGQQAGEYFAGYLIEYSLSVDNMFLFLVIFSYFKVPTAYRHRVLFYGILGAIVFRGIFIALGTALLQNFEWVIYLFGALLIFTAYRIAKGTEEVHPEDNPILRFAERRFRSTTKFDGQRLFTVVEGKRLATPLFFVLLAIETTDVVFAIDSIPAIFAVTRDPFIVLTSNVFAILGLRSLYFLLSGAMARFHLLKYGLAVILAFVGSKMLLSEIWHPPILLSLSVIVGVLVITAIASAKFPQSVTEEHLPEGAEQDE